MINRRQILGSSLALGGLSVGGLALTGCGAAPAAVSAVAGSATTATVVAAVATTVAAFADIALATFTTMAALAKKDTQVVLAETNAGDPAGRVASTARFDDTLARLDRIESDLQSVIQFQKAPILPGRPEPERWYRIEPVIWDGSQRVLGNSYEIRGEDFPTRITLFAPGYEEHPITTPGLYRVGFRLTTEDNENEMLGGGPFLHIFADHEWNYERILSEYGEARPDTVNNYTYPVDPANHLDYIARQVSPT